MSISNRTGAEVGALTIVRDAQLSASLAQELDFRAIFREHAAFVWRVLRRHGVAECDLPDLCQEVFVVVHRKLAEFKGEASLRTWLYGIAMRVARAQLRLARVQRERLPGELPPVADQRTPEQEASAQRALRILEHACASLSEEQREAFVLFELEELSLTEVAIALNLPKSTVFARIRSARSLVDAHIQRLEARAANTLSLRRASAGGLT